MESLALLQVQFNLHLSEKERVDKAKVVLPFEHQGMLHLLYLVHYMMSSNWYAYSKVM